MFVYLIFRYLIPHNAHYDFTYIRNGAHYVKSPRKWLGACKFQCRLGVLQRWVMCDGRMRLVVEKKPQHIDRQTWKETATV